MQQSNRDKLEKHRPKLNLWINDKSCHLNIEEKAEILQVIREEFDPNYHVDMYCGSCVVAMMVFAFKRMDETKVDTITVPLHGMSGLGFLELYKKPKKK